VSENKTMENDRDVVAFLNCVENPRRAEDARVVAAMMQRVTGCAPRMWGDSIIGFDRYEYARKDGSRHTFMMTGVSPRKAALTVYVMPGFSAYTHHLARLGRHRHSTSCLYLPNLADIDMGVLEEIIADSVKSMRARYGTARS
jgi:hypothetical protein